MIILVMLFIFTMNILLFVDSQCTCMHVCSASFVGEGEDQITFTALTVIIARTDVISPMAMISLTHTSSIPCMVTSTISNHDN